MEDKQLDFNAPLLSVRRLTSNAASNTEERTRNEKFQPKKPSFVSYKSEPKPEPLRNPGAVPFVWERIPGRPKDGSGPRSNAPHLPPLAPKLPPGRIVDVKEPSSAKSIEDREPEALTVNKLPKDDDLANGLHALSSIGDAASLERSKRDARQENSADVDYCDDVFSDVHETLSRTGSFFMNCSLSGLSALEGPGLRPSGSASSDHQARDFMMDRFLPAAKAMASETPQYSSRKQAREPIRSVRKVNIADERRLLQSSEGDKQPLHYQSKTYHVSQVQDVEEDSDDDDDEDYDDTGNLMTKACGILPRFCLKNSLCLLNPVPGMKIQSQMPSSSVRRKVTAHMKTDGSEHLSEAGLENTWEAVYKHKLLRGIQPTGTCDDGSKPTSESNQLTYWSDSQTPDGSSSYRRSTGDGISPYRNEAPQSPFREGMVFLGVPKQGNKYRSNGIITYGNSCNDDSGMFSCHSSKHGSGSLSPAIEKTLYVDSVRMIRSPNSGSSSSDVKELTSAAERDSELLLESERLDKSLILEGHLGGSNQAKNFNERDLLQPEISDTVEPNLLSCSEDSIVGVAMDNRKGFRDNNGLVQEAKSLECSKELINRTPGFDMPEPLDGGNSYASLLQSPQPPPLPKSPSESWLCRTLPSVSSMNPSSRSYLGVQFRSRKQLVRASSVDPKWETIVKTSNAQHKHLRFSEELRIHSCEASES